MAVLTVWARLESQLLNFPSNKSLHGIQDSYPRREHSPLEADTDDLP